MSNIDYKNIGLAELNQDGFTVVELFAGDSPAVVTDHGVISAAQSATGIPAWTPVHVDPATREVTVAVYDDTVPANTVLANAITVADVVPGAAEGSACPVYKAGMFNINALNFDASFETEALKASAFNTAQCQIYVKAPFYG